MKNRTAVILVVLAVITFSSFTPVFSAPSGQTWSIEGGGFCQGTYTLYNNSAVDNKIYAENCATGVNDFSGTETGGVFNSVIGNMAVGGTVHFRTGFFGVKNTMNLQDINGITIEGSGGPSLWQASQTPRLQFGTYLIAQSGGSGVVNGYMFKNCNSPAWASTPTLSGSCTSLNYFAIRDLVMNNNFLNTTMILFAEGELAGQFLISNVQFSTFGGFQGPAVCVDWQGGEGLTLFNDVWSGNGSSGDCAIDLYSYVPAGTVVIEDSQMDGVQNIVSDTQSLFITNTNVQSTKFICTSGLTATENTIVSMNGGYTFNPQGTSQWNINGCTVQAIILESTINQVRGASDPWFTGTGTVHMFSTAGGTWALAASCVWNSGGPTVTNSKTGGNNYVTSGSACTGFPYTITSSVF